MKLGRQVGLFDTDRLGLVSLLLLSSRDTVFVWVLNPCLGSVGTATLVASLANRRLFLPQFAGFSFQPNDSDAMFRIQRVVLVSGDTNCFPAPDASCDRRYSCRDNIKASSSQRGWPCRDVQMING